MIAQGKPACQFENALIIFSTVGAYIDITLQNRTRDLLSCQTGEVGERSRCPSFNAIQFKIAFDHQSFALIKTKSPPIFFYDRGF